MLVKIKWRPCVTQPNASQKNSTNTNVNSNAQYVYTLSKNDMPSLSI